MAREAASIAEGERLDPAIWKISAVAVLGSFLSVLDATVVNVSLATLAGDLHSSLGTMQWVTSGYLLALTLMLPLNAWLVERIGAKALYLWCFALFTGSSVLCGLAWSAGSLIGFRVLQGMSGGLLAPMAQMMIARAAGRHMARVIGYAAVPVMLAPILGPVLAGAILSQGSWRWLFLVNLPVAAVALVLAALFLPREDGFATARRPLDLAGFALLSPALVLLLYGSEHLSARAGMAALPVAVALLAVFVATALRKGDRALLDLKLFANGTFQASVVTQFLSNGIGFAGQMLIPYFLVRGWGRSPGEVGWLLMPTGLGMMLAFPMMGAMTKRFGIRRVAATGAALALAGTLPFMRFAMYGPGALSGKVLAAVVVALFVRGVGLGAIGVPSITAAYSTIAKQELPMATTTLNIVQRLGGPILTTLCASLLAWGLDGSGSGRVAGSGAGLGPFGVVFLVLCGLQGVLLLATLQLPMWLRPLAAERG